MSPTLVFCIVALLLTWSGLEAKQYVRGNGYEYFCVGQCDKDVTTATQSGLMLAGGGTDVDEGFKWMIQLSGGGNFVVIRASGTAAYNPYIFDMGGIASVSTFIFSSRDGANDDFVHTKLSQAEALFIAGGDQWMYVTLWNNTKVQQAIQHLQQKNVPLGGTSAGLHSLGDFLFTAEFDTITSEQALRNPYDKYLTLGHKFLGVSPFMKNVITDSHFYNRDRMGRSITFLARLMVDYKSISNVFKGICVDEATALLVDHNGIGRVKRYNHTQASSVYMLMTTETPTVCEKNKPLSFSNVLTYKLTHNESFDLVSWKPLSPVAAPPALVKVKDHHKQTATTVTRVDSHYYITASSGHLSSTQQGGHIYYDSV